MYLSSFQCCISTCHVSIQNGQNIAGSFNIDDILVTGDSEKQHLQNLEEVLRQLKDNGLRLNCAKCSFFQGSVEYLGRQIDAQGVHTADTKVKAIREVLPPKNIDKLHSFLGLMNYYRKFI